MTTRTISAKQREATKRIQPQTIDSFFTFMNDRVFTQHDHDYGKGSDNYCGFTEGKRDAVHFYEIFYGTTNQGTYDEVIGFRLKKFSRRIQPEGHHDYIDAYRLGLYESLKALTGFEPKRISVKKL